MNPGMNSRCLSGLLLLLLLGCHPEPPRPKYVIALSQPTMADQWRESMVQEMERELIFYPDVKLIITDAQNDNQKQINQIDSLIHIGIDLLIVSPNEVEPLTDKISTVYKSGIPVVLIDRVINSYQYTCYIGADNREIGKIAGQYAASKLSGKGNILEVIGLPGSSPAIERHKGFQGVIDQHDSLEIVQTVEGNWQAEYTLKAFDKLDIKLDNIDLIYCHNDEMAQAVNEYLLEKKIEKEFLILGIDALAGSGGGIQMVLDQIIDATFLYPTGGEEAVSTAMEILLEKPVPKEIKLSTSIIDIDNALLMKFQGDKLIKQQSTINQQGEILEARNKTLKNQRLVGALLIFMVLTLMILTLIVLVQLRTKKQINHVLRRQNEEITEQKRLLEDLDLENQEPGTKIPDDPKDRLLSIDQMEIKINRLREESRYHELHLLQNLDDFITKNLSNPNLNIDLIGEHMKLSRVQLYRKLKGLTGISVIDYIQHIRLAHAKELMSASGLSLSEIAEQCGFNSASYFSTTFKNQFGMSPIQWKKSRMTAR